MKADHEVQLVPMTVRDLELVMAWRSHPTAYQFFKAQEGPLRWAEHLKFWYSRKHRKDFIIKFYEDGRWRKVGNLNITLLNTQIPEIGIIVGELTAQNKGIGSRAIAVGLKKLTELGYSKAAVVIHIDNIASQRLFKKFKFRLMPDQTQSSWQRYVLESLDV